MMRNAPLAKCLDFDCRHAVAFTTKGSEEHQHPSSASPPITNESRGKNRDGQEVEAHQRVIWEVMLIISSSAVPFFPVSFFAGVYLPGVSGGGGACRLAPFSHNL